MAEDATWAPVAARPWRSWPVVSPAERFLLRMVSVAAVTALVPVVLVAVGVVLMGAWGYAVAVVAFVPVCGWLAAVWVLWSTSRAALAPDSPLRLMSDGVPPEYTTPIALGAAVMMRVSVVDPVAGWLVRGWAPVGDGAGQVGLYSPVVGACGVVVLAVVLGTRWRRDAAAFARGSLRPG